MENLINLAKSICKSCDDVQLCIDDTNFLCEVLNKCDRFHLKSYYNHTNSGPVVDVRKEVCKEILLHDINADTLTRIVTEAKEKNPSAFKSWINNFSILHPILISTFENFDVDPMINKFVDIFEGGVNHKIWGFQGPRNQGRNNYTLLFFNKSQKSHSTSLQFFCDFNPNNKIRFGIWKESSKEYIVNPLECGFEDLQKVLDSAISHKDVILNDNVEQGESSHTFQSAAIEILKQNGNNPMTAKEIWAEVESKGLYKSKGQTPELSMTTILLASSINSNISKKFGKPLFECVGEKPIRFKLIHYMTDRSKQTLEENGFMTEEKISQKLKDDGYITLDMLKKILEQHNVQI